MPLPAAMQRPWALAESAAAEVAEAYARLNLTALAQSGAPVRENSRAEIVGNVAVIPVTRALFSGGSPIDEMVASMVGGTLYEEVAADFDAAMASPATVIVLHFRRCPGGDADGCGALADRIYAARGQGKRLVAVGEGMIASAGYWIGSACDEMIAAPSAFIGSIGVRGGLTDTSALDQKLGIKQIEIVAGQSPDKRSTPIDDDVIARAQLHADELADLFIAAVARHRGTSAEDVAANFGKGDVVIASKALEAGMVDGIGTLDDVLDEYSEGDATPAPATNQQPAASGTGVRQMAIQRGGKPLRASAEPDKEDKKDGAKAEADDKPEMEKCGECGGSGKNADGAKCKHCEGSGEIEAEADEPDDKAEHEEPDGDEEKHEGKKALAALSGLALSASYAAHAEAIAARMVPNADFRRLNSRLEAIEAERKAEVASAHEAKCAELVASAEARGYLAGLDDKAAADKRKSLLAVARRDYAAAEMVIAELPAARVEGRKTANGAPLGGKHSNQPKISAFADDVGGRIVAHGDVSTIERGSPDLMAKAIAHAAAHKCSIEEAMGAVVKADPSLMQ